jgi:cytochrome c5
VSASHDRHFFDSFMLVLGVLVALALGFYALARMVAAETQETNVLQDRVMVAAANTRLEPVARVAVAGRDNSALEPPKPAQVAVATELGGEEVYNSTCMACHGAGVAGAPKFGDKGAWGARLAKGIDTLHKHALEGFQGGAGFMPAKGGRTDLSDKTIMAGVDFMVKAAK